MINISRLFFTVILLSAFICSALAETAEKRENTTDGIKHIRNDFFVFPENKIGNTEIAMVFESAEFDTKELLDYLKIKMPSYMIPTQLKFVKEFPLNNNGKTDRKILIQRFSL